MDGPGAADARLDPTSSLHPTSPPRPAPGTVAGPGPRQRSLGTSGQRLRARPRRRDRGRTRDPWGEGECESDGRWGFYRGTGTVASRRGALRRRRSRSPRVVAGGLGWKGGFFKEEGGGGGGAEGPPAPGKLSSDCLPLLAGYPLSQPRPAADLGRRCGRPSPARPPLALRPVFRAAGYPCAALRRPRPPPRAVPLLQWTSLIARRTLRSALGPRAVTARDRERGVPCAPDPPVALLRFPT